jgi:hypothetical protein
MPLLLRDVHVMLKSLPLELLREVLRDGRD